MKKASLVVMMLCLGLSLAACGYNFRGKQNNLPSDVRTIAIPVLENQTGELRIERTFTDEIIFQFTRSQMLRVVSEGQADAILKAIIKKVETEDVSLSKDQTSKQRRVTITISAQLIRTSDGSVLWENRALEKNRTFTVGSTVQATDQLKQAAITELARDMAQSLHDSVFENF